MARDGSQETAQKQLQTKLGLKVYTQCHIRRGHLRMGDDVDTRVQVGRKGSERKKNDGSEPRRERAGRQLMDS